MVENVTRDHMKHGGGAKSEQNSMGIAVFHSNMTIIPRPSGDRTTPAQANPNSMLSAPILVKPKLHRRRLQGKPAFPYDHTPRH